MPIDANGVMYDGTKIDGPAELRDALLKHQDVFLQTFTDNLMTYALGRRVEYYDMPAVRAIVRNAARNDLHFSAFVLGIVNSAAFQRRAIEPAQTTAQARSGARTMFLTTEAAVAARGPERDWRLGRAAVSRRDDAGRARRWRPPTPASCASWRWKWCTASPAHRLRRRRRTCGRRPRPARRSTSRRRRWRRSSPIATTSRSSATPIAATPRRSRRRKSAAITSARRRSS